MTDSLIKDRRFNSPHFMEIEEHDASFIRFGIGSMRQDILFTFTLPRNPIPHGRHIILSLNIDASCAVNSPTNWSLPASKTCSGSCQAKATIISRLFWQDGMPHLDLEE